jgi:hypothetical protein
MMRLVRLLKLIVRMVVINPWRSLRIRIIRWLFRLRGRLRKESLRDAIDQADSIKKKTGRKAMVVFNNYSGKYEPLQKRHLKGIVRKATVKSSKTTSRSKKKKRVINHSRVKQIENRSLYVT